jgi:patched 1 protein/patched 2 protein
MFAQNLGADVGPNLAVMKTTRQTVDGINAKLGTNIAYMYGYTFLFFEQYLHSSHDLYMVVGLALGKPYCTLQFPFAQVLSIIHELASTHISSPYSNCSTYIVTPI